MKAHHCPVCDMEVLSSSISAEHYGILYFFCSDQCRENFISRSSLYVGDKSQKKLGKQEIKKRSFTLDKPVSKSNTQALESMLTGMMGVHDVLIADAKISITYDLLQVTALQIEKELERSGNRLGIGWGGRLKRGWVHYTEENELEILAENDAPCCNKPPAKG